MIEAKAEEILKVKQAYGGNAITEEELEKMRESIMDILNEIHFGIKK